jgi:hypothetical protein
MIKQQAKRYGRIDNNGNVVPRLRKKLTKEEKRERERIRKQKQRDKTRERLGDEEYKRQHALKTKKAKSKKES